ncbi:MAG: 16S rRNA (uracil(1498)-N(3))-methyltransferase [Elusimicrobia bacterium HGW-Elusimicrobia-4]|nr:MAG: 16S rRNA (uracil(1498)-N(3))-methyltransferase [Elusimicrobia bacterium HGW-Elusimicrobia-4]
MQRFFVENIDGDIAEISGSEAHHLKDVLRKKVGDAVFLFDGKGNEYTAEIERLRDKEIELKILSKTQRNSEPKIKINLYQSIPKLKKFDFIVEKSTELGVSKIIPVISERTVPELSLRAKAKQSRWQKIALSAAKQCGRTVVPEISSITDFQSAVKSVCVGKNLSESVSLIPWECEQKTTLKQLLSDAKASATHSLLAINLFIGPEGGFSTAEIERACKCGIIPITLGKRILRTETASIVVISNILYELEN